MEIFFIQSCSIDEITDIEELLLRKYSNIDYILGMNYLDGFTFIRKAFEKERDEHLWQRWLVDYRRMSKDNFISFGEYRESATKVNEEENITKKEIEEKVKTIIDMTL